MKCENCGTDFETMKERVKAAEEDIKAIFARLHKADEHSLFDALCGRADKIGETLNITRYKCDNCIFKIENLILLNYCSKALQASDALLQLGMDN